MKLRIPPLQIQYWLTVFVAGVLWLVGFMYGSGWGGAHDVYGKAELITIAVFVIYLLRRGQLRYIPLKIFILLLYLVLCFAYYKLRFDKSLLEYFWLFLLLPLMKQLELDEKQMRWISLLFLLGCFVILGASEYTTILRGWDENSISIPAFFSYTVFAVSYGDTKNWKRIVFFILVSLVYFYLLLTMNSRSSILFSVFLALSVFSIIPMKQFIKKRAFLLLLLAPLIVAVLVVLIRNTPFVDNLNMWSIEHLHKTIFSGRDNIWYNGFQTWLQHPLIGNGSFSYNWHNSAVTLLVGVGAVGYIIYLAVIALVLRRVSAFSADYIARGLILAFLTIWLQQSLELGLVAPKGNTIPFLILGLALARARTLEKKDELEAIGNHPGL